MKPASFLGLFVSASLVFASTAALAAPGAKKKPDGVSPAPPEHGRTKKGGTSAPAPAKKPAKKGGAKAEKAEAEAETEAAPAPAPAPVAPETKAADAKPAEVAPVPVASASSSDHAGASKHRDDEESGKAFAVAPLLGYGTNYLNFGIGARAGYTFPMKLYVGGTFMYHLGQSYGAGFGGSEYSYKAFYPAGEVGYDFRVGPVTIRPYGGIGLVFVTVTLPKGLLSGESQSATDNSLAIYPGATAQWNIPRSDFFVGGDTRLLFITKGGEASFGLFATAGMKF